MAPKPAQPGFSPKLGEIRQAFPLPGRYHFRFKAALVPGSDRDKDCIPVWMDCVDDNHHVSVWRGGIFAKVTRISLDQDAFVDERSSISSNEGSSGYKNVEMPSQSVHSSVSTATPGFSQHGTSTPVVTETLLDVFDAPSVSSSSVPSVPSANTDPLSLFGGIPTVSAAVPANGATEGSLLDMDAPLYPSSSSSSAQRNYSTSAHVDFLGMTVTATPSNDVNAPRPNSTVLPMTNQPPITMPPAIQSKLPPSRSGSTNAFNTFSQKSGPFGDLEWK